MKAILLLFVLTGSLSLSAQTYIVKDIKWFGAKGDGKTADHNAFIKAAAYFNKRGGNGKLVLSKGIYLVGRQIFTKNTTTSAVYQGVALLEFTGCKNLTIEAVAGSLIKYRDSLRFGAFDPATGQPFNHGNNYFVNYPYVASVGAAISLIKCSNIQLKNIWLNGNNAAFIYGGVYGDTGIQIPHIGIYISNSKNILVEGVKANYFGLDGAMVGNDTTQKSTADKIVFRNCSFEYNCRQGLSWVGGNDLTAIGCNFNHTGRSRHQSAPGAGVDVEAELGPVRNGKFISCSFINNTGCGLVADTGPGADCTFTGCTFWGTTAWSAWVTRPGFSFINSKFYGAFVHGYNAATDKEATKFYACLFEDKPYRGKEPYGNFLVETNYIKRMRFENCTMLSHRKKIVWMESAPAWLPEEKYQFINCKLQYDGDNLPDNDWIALTRNIRFINSSFEIKSPNAKKKNYWFNGLGEKYNVNLGGNKVSIYKQTTAL